MKREMFGPRSERSQRLIDQLELQLEELAATAGEDDATGGRRRGGTFPPICRAGGLFTPRRRLARAAAARTCRRSARMSPRRSTSSRGNGS